MLLFVNMVAMETENLHLFKVKWEAQWVWKCKNRLYMCTNAPFVSSAPFHNR